MHELAIRPGYIARSRLHGNPMIDVHNVRKLQSRYRPQHFRSRSPLSPCGWIYQFGYAIKGGSPYANMYNLCRYELRWNGWNNQVEICVTCPTSFLIFQGQRRALILGAHPCIALWVWICASDPLPSNEPTDCDLKWSWPCIVLACAYLWQSQIYTSTRAERWW